jgi:alanyl-tRNA synthetase
LLEPATNVTDRLYYTDAYLPAFRARVIETRGDGSRLVLDRTAFYPASGGQPNDTGRIAGIPVVDVVEEGKHVVHLLSSPVSPGEVDCEIDWDRRFDHMQQHTGQHLLSAVFEDLFGYATISFHMGAESSTIDLECPAISMEQAVTAEFRANQIVQQNRRVTLAFEDAATATGLRKPTDRKGELRVVAIEGIDRSACGGTHVRATGEIGPILLRSQDKIRGNIRLEFLCGLRAVRRARADYSALVSAARVFSGPVDELPALVAAQSERLKDAAKIRRNLETEVAGYRGRALHAATSSNDRGTRLHTRIVPEGPFGDDLRAEANSFIAAGNAIFVAVAERPPSVLVASSADSGVSAGILLKSALSEFDGKGGGSATMAQGSFRGDPQALLERLLRQLSE